METGKLKVYYWVNNGGTPNIHAFCVYGAAKLKMNTGFVSNSRKKMSLLLKKTTFSMKVLVSLVLNESFSCSMSVKAQFFQNHSEYFSKNLGALIEEQGERFQKKTLRLYRGDTKVDGTLL